MCMTACQLRRQLVTTRQNTKLPFICSTTLKFLSIQLCRIHILEVQSQKGILHFMPSPGLRDGAFTVLGGL